MDYDIIERNIEENNTFQNKDKNKINQRSNDKSKYNIIGNKNIDHGNFGENKQILINDGN